jgi:hypothetical protein
MPCSVLLVKCIAAIGVPVTLARRPLWFLAKLADLLLLDEAPHVLVLIVNHVVFDRWSFGAHERCHQQRVQPANETGVVILPRAKWRQRMVAAGVRAQDALRVLARDGSAHELHHQPATNTRGALRLRCQRRHYNAVAAGGNFQMTLGAAISISKRGS